MLKTNLVDFDTLDHTAPAARRNELLKGVASLFAFASERCTIEQIEIYDEVLLKLSEMVELEAMIFAAEKLAPLRRAPERIVRRLAEDDAIAIAGPMLTHSPALKEQDLIALAEVKGNAHLQAIAQRATLSKQLTEVVVRRGDQSVRRTIASNPGAVLGEVSLAELVQQAMNDVVTAEALDSRLDTPDAVIEDLVRHGAEEVRKVLAERGIGAPAERLDLAARQASMRMSNAYWLGLYDFESAWERLMAQGGVSAASEALLCQCVIEDRFADVVAVFALLADLNLEETKHWLVRTDTEPFLVIAKAMGLRFTTVQAMLKAGPWRHRLTQEQRRDALNNFQTMETRVARARLSAWREGRPGG